MIFDSKISIICTLKGCFWPKHIIFKLSKYRGVMFDDTQNWCKVEEKLTCASKNDMRNLGNFHQSTFEDSLKIGTFIGSFYPE